MKKINFLFIITLFILKLSNGQENLDYFLPQNIRYNPDIPVPEKVICHEVGEWHVTHDKLISYMKEIARLSNRAVLQEYGRSYENRPLVHLVVTSPENHQKLEQIRKEHLTLSDPFQSINGDINDMPLVITLGYNVHGNEASGGNSALLIAYYLAAAEGSEIEQLLQNAVILIDPCLNPDGFNRFTTWVNMHKSNTPVTDPNSIEFDEFWPGGRTNHYWFDLNRDWLLLQNPESQGRVKRFYQWMPNIYTDHHEMGSNSTFFFQPGILSRNNPLTPEKNYYLTQKIAKHFARSLDKIGSLYFSEEVFDDFYFGKGSSYPDINGSIGILFEQGSIRGHARETNFGIRTFAFAIRNQFTVSLSTLEAGIEHRKELLGYQQEFYRSAIEKAKNNKVKAYLFGDINDRGKVYHFVDLLKQHNIKVYELKQDIRLDNKLFNLGKAYIVPVEQPQYHLIESLFRKVTKFADSTFYDISSWTLPLSFNLDYTGITSMKELDNIVGKEIINPSFPDGKVTGGQSSYAYLFKWDEYHTPGALYELMKNGVRTSVATKPFRFESGNLKKDFSYGTILVPVQSQKMSSDKLFDLMEKISDKNGLEIFAVETALTPSGIDLGSSSFASLEKPEILLLTGEGIRSRDAGEIWHLFDTRYKIPVTLAKTSRLMRIDINRYNVLIMPGGSYENMEEQVIPKIKQWVENGGTLVACKNANRWISRQKLADIKYKKRTEPDSTAHYRYADRNKNNSVQRISGGIFETQVDLSHPLLYGYYKYKLPVFKNGNDFVEKSNNPYANPIIYTNSPVISGYIPDNAIDKMKNSPFAGIYKLGQGTIISLFDNTNFRGVWYGTNKIFANSVFFGQIIR